MAEKKALLDCSLDDLIKSNRNSRKRRQNPSQDDNDAYSPPRKRQRHYRDNRGYNDRRHNDNWDNGSQHNFQTRHRPNNRSNNRYDNRYDNRRENRSRSRDFNNYQRSDQSRDRGVAMRGGNRGRNYTSVDNIVSYDNLPVAPTDNYYREEVTTTSDESSPGCYAYTTLLMCGSEFLPGAVILAHSLKMAGCKHTRIVMVTDDIDEKCVRILGLVYDYVIRVPYLRYKGVCKRMKTNKQQQKYEEWMSESFTKWNHLQINHLLQQSTEQIDDNPVLKKPIDIDNDSIPQFTKVLFLDSDKIVIKNIDDLFENIQCPAGTFSSPWAPAIKKSIIAEAGGRNGLRFENRFFSATNQRGLKDYYPRDLEEGAVVPAMSIYNALYKDGFVAVGTGMLLEPDYEMFQKFQSMLNDRLISDENLANNIDFEKPSLDIPITTTTTTLVTDDMPASPVSKPKCTPDFQDSPDKPSTPRKSKEDWHIGFTNCYSMLDEQSIAFLYYYHRIPWHFISPKYNFIPWRFNWLENKDSKLETPSILHFFGVKPWNQSPLEWRDLQAWWTLALHLGYMQGQKMYGWSDDDNALLLTAFKAEYLNALPLGLPSEDIPDSPKKEKKEEQEVYIPKGKREEQEQQQMDQQKQEQLKKKMTGHQLIGATQKSQTDKHKPTCFWCFELAKRKGLETKPKSKFDAGEIDESQKKKMEEEIEWVFHHVIDPSSGKLICPNLLLKIED